MEIEGRVLDAALLELIESGGAVGASVLVYSGDHEIYFGAVGQADRESGRPWQRDTLAAIYSMTKPITGVTLMSLYEDGLFELDDPLAKYLPEYAEVKVFSGTDASGELLLEPPSRPIEVIDLLRHTAGFGYDWGDSPIALRMAEAGVLDPAKPLSQFSEELAEIPLFHHPGEQWKYGVAVDVQARLAEVLAGQPYETIVHERVLGPLGMTDTGYHVHASKRPRLAAVYNRYQDGAINREPNASVYSFWDKKPVQINGGHGLISTADDYMRFARMLQNGGTLDSVEILKPETVALMTRDQLPDTVTEWDFLKGKGQMGFGLDFAVRIAPPADANEPFGVEGEFFWDGAATTLFWVDPKNDITVVFLTQVFPFDLKIHAKVRRALYEALGLIDTTP
ncbi:MAG: serine hydrolase domain-containing protein [Planctomycetota bacterium]